MSEFKLSYKESEKQILSANNIAEDIITNIEKSRYELNETHDSGENFAGTAMKASKKGFENTLISFPHRNSYNSRHRLLPDDRASGYSSPRLPASTLLSDGRHRGWAMCFQKGDYGKVPWIPPV